MRKLLAVIACVVLMGCGEHTATPAVFTVTGEVVVDSDVPGTRGDPCQTKAGYEDFDASAQVTVADNTGAKLAVAPLGVGTYGPSPAGDVWSYTCRFPFTVANVPEGKPLYEIAAGRQTRGSVTFQRDRLSAPVTLTLN